MELTDAQWQVIRPVLPEPKRRKDGRGRPWRNAREVLNGIVWVLNKGGPWSSLPRTYPPYQTCHRRYLQWRRDGTMNAVLSILNQWDANPIGVPALGSESTTKPIVEQSALTEARLIS